jgi:hypothetical protein
LLICWRLILGLFQSSHFDAAASHGIGGVFQIWRQGLRRPAIVVLGLRKTSQVQEVVGEDCERLGKPTMSNSDVRKSDKFPHADATARRWFVMGAPHYWLWNF